MPRRSLAAALPLILCAALVAKNSSASGEDKVPKRDTRPAVVIDFSNWSVQPDGDVTFTIEYEGYTGVTPYTTGGADAGDFAESLHRVLTTKGIVKGELFDKTKVRIFGYTKDGKFYPALQGKVTSKTLKLEQLPKVINPPKG